MNVLFRGDVLSVLQRLDPGRTQLVYLDPPWFTESTLTTIKTKQLPTIRDYLQFTAEVAASSRQTLSETGLSVFHIEPRLAGQMRLILDRIFGRDRFRYEAILPRWRPDTVTTHESFLFYSKGKESKFFPPSRRLTEREIEERFPGVDQCGRFRLLDMTSPSSRNANLAWRGVVPPAGRSWRFSVPQMDEFWDQGLVYQKDKSSLPRLKHYAKDATRVRLGTVWDDVRLVPLGKERTGFTAQQPLALLERIIEMTTEPGDLVVDPFCGSGTTLVAASRLRREWVGGDNLDEAIKISVERLQGHDGVCAPVEFHFEDLGTNSHFAAQTKAPSVNVYLGLEEDQRIMGSDHVTKTYDCFISHASEDKQDFVRPLAIALESRGYRVWYDEFALTVGDSLAESIDRGLAESRFGIVVLSTHFFQKGWPRRELNGLTAREIDQGKVILPIWYNVTKDDVLKYSPTLADKLAINSSGLSIEQIVSQLAKVLDTSGTRPS